ncbi:hypothetical protein CR513_40835, partial [Mucuna pruriens]
MYISLFVYEESSLPYLLIVGKCLPIWSYWRKQSVQYLMWVLSKPLVLMTSKQQKVSSNKTRIYFSINVPWQVKVQISKELGLQWTNALGKYLEILVLHKRATEDTYQFIVDKVNHRLSASKAK